MERQSAASRQLRANNREALQVLHSVDTRDEVTDSLYVDSVYLAACVCEAPLAYLSVGEGRQQRIVAKVGFSAGQPLLNDGIGMQALLQGVELLVVEDAQRDARVNADRNMVFPSDARFVAGILLRGQRGNILGSLCVFDDRPRALSTRQKQALLALARQVAARLEAANQITRLHERVQCFETCLDHSPALVTIKDKDSRYRYANAAFLKLAGKELSEVLGRTDAELWPSDMAKRLSDHDKNTRNTRKSYSRVEIMNQPGDVCRYWQVHRFMIKGTQNLLASIGFDVTEWKANEQHLIAAQELLKRSLENLEVLSVTDGLTGLHNRRSFEERLKEEFERARRYNLPLSLLMLDADRFKEFNDACGHPAGDHLLKEIALILKQNARANDVAARYGGDEFVVILPNTDSKVAFHLAERLRRAAKALCHHDHPITISVGVSALKTEMENPHSLLVAADKALYDAKRKGRNRVSHTIDFCA